MDHWVILYEIHTHVLTDSGVQFITRNFGRYVPF